MKGSVLATDTPIARGLSLIAPSNTKGFPMMKRSIPWSFPLGVVLMSLAIMTIGMPERTVIGDDAQSEFVVEPDVLIVMKDKMFHVLKGGDAAGDPLFAMEAGIDTMITLRNEDAVAHEFVSPFFLNVEVMVSGDATTVFTKDAVGFRVDGGKSVTIRFPAPRVEPGAKVRKDLFWCNVHGKDPGDKMRGELVLMETKRLAP